LKAAVLKFGRGRSVMLRPAPLAFCSGPHDVSQSRRCLRPRTKSPAACRPTGPVRGLTGRKLFRPCRWMHSADEPSQGGARYSSCRSTLYVELVHGEGVPPQPPPRYARLGPASLDHAHSVRKIDSASLLPQANGSLQDADFGGRMGCLQRRTARRAHLSDLNIGAETVWRWALQDIHVWPDVTEINGTVGSLEKAKAAVYADFRKWIAWAERDRPLGPPPALRGRADRRRIGNRAAPASVPNRNA